MEPLILDNVVEKQKFDPIKAGIYVAMLSGAEIKLMPNFETQEPEEKLSFSFKLIRPVTGGVIKDVKDVEHPPCRRYMFKACDKSFFYVKGGVKTLKVAGKIVEALGMDPFANPINLTSAIGKYVILNITVGPSFNNPMVLKDKIADFIKFEGNVEEIDQIVAQAAADAAGDRAPLDYSPPAAPEVETTLDAELESTATATPKK